MQIPLIKMEKLQEGGFGGKDEELSLGCFKSSFGLQVKMSATWIGTEMYVPAVLEKVLA